MIVGAADGQTGSKVGEGRCRKALSEYVCVLERIWNVNDLHLTQCNLFSDKMKINFDVFSTCLTGFKDM